jgi:RNA polymerase-binding transcription factor DksA
MLSKDKIEFLKKKLEKERLRLETDLGRIGKRNPNVPGDWEMAAGDLNIETADKSEISDAFEELETRAAIEDKLEERLIFVNQALNRIKKGVYGICLVCKKPIEEKRLEVNPAARHCIKHAVWQ